MKGKNSIQLTPGGADYKHKMSSALPIESESSSDGQTINFTLKAEAVVTHDEHDEMRLEAGDYVKTNQMEYNPFTNSIDYVFD